MIVDIILIGEVLEWSNRTVLKTVVQVSVPWVRIPPSPPEKLFIKYTHIHLKEYKEVWEIY